MGYQQIDSVLRQINSLKIQGATAVARAVLQAYLEFGKRLRTKRASNWKQEMKAALNYLQSRNRPTEPLARNALLFVWNRIKSQPNIFLLQKSSEEFLKLIEETQQRIGLLGHAIIKSNDKIYTHCHSSTVEQLLVQTYKKKRFKVYASETRPLYQGRITARQLRKFDIPVTLVADSAGPFLISEASGRELMMDSVIIGADAILADGSVVNKTGSYGLTTAARADKVPVYVVASLLKYARGLTLTIEKRPAKEIWPKAPSGVKILNYAFDKVPAKNITCLVTEFGLIQPNEVRSYLKKYYSWLAR